jgi:hypothetical protein
LVESRVQAELRDINPSILLPESIGRIPEGVMRTALLQKAQLDWEGEFSER